MGRLVVGLNCKPEHQNGGEHTNFTLSSKLICYDMNVEHV